MVVRALFLCLFFASGAAALVYQVVWQRLLTFTTGADIQAVTIVIAAFMVGLGLGSLAGGAIADRVSDRRRLWAFAACEFAIAAFALASAHLFYDILYVRFGSSNLSAAALGSLSFLATLWPTFFMGMSLPLAARIVTADARQPAAWVPILYGWNTLGAAAGAFLAVTVLFRTFDFSASLRIGAALNAAFGVAAVIIGLRVRDAGARSAAVSNAPADDASPDPDDRALIPSMGHWMAVYAVSGFIALSLEVVWFRILGIVLKSTALTFGILLGMYLTGLGAGSLAARTRWARRLPPARSFLMLQATIAVWAAITITGLVWIAGTSLASPLSVYLGGYAGLPWQDVFSPMFILVNMLIPVVLMGPPTFFMGLSFGSLQRAVQTDIDDLGRRVGWLQASNIFGAVIGALLTGFLLLEKIGTSGTLQLLVAMSGIFVWLLFRGPQIGTAAPARSRLRAAGAAAVVAGAILVVPAGRVMWPRLHGVPQGGAVYAEDGTGLALFKPEPEGGRIAVFANGLGQSRLPWGGVHTALGALPALVHPHPATIAVIGLGSGDTTFSVGGRPETTRIDSIEIVGAALSSLRELDQDQPHPGLRELLSDPRISHHLTDGRAFLLRTRTRYDIIEADALRPSSAYAGNLYSVEYFRLLRSRLKPGGFAATWTPTPRSLNSLVAAFPHVLVVGQIGFGSDTPVRFEVDEIRARMNAPSTVAYYRAAGLDIAEQLASYLSATPRVFTPDTDRSSLDLNHDLFPKDEFKKK